MSMSKSNAGLFFSALLFVSSIFLPLTTQANDRAAESLAACLSRCNADERNQANDIKYGETTIFSKCQVSCRGANSALETMKEQDSKEWDPNNPIVQKCFAENGASNKFGLVSNHATNNCIMEKVNEERDAARKEQATKNAVVPADKPKTEAVAKENPAKGDTGATPATTPTPTASCDESQISQLEAQCQNQRSAAVSACDSSKLSNAPAPQQSSGAKDPCAQANAYNAQAGQELNNFRNTCSSSLGPFKSSCSQFQSAANAMPASCGSLATSYQSSAGAMMNIVAGLEGSIAKVDQQQAQYADGSTDAAACAAGTNAKADDPNSDPLANINGTKNTTPLNENFDTNGSLRPGLDTNADYSVAGSLPKGVNPHTKQDTAIDGTEEGEKRRALRANNIETATASPAAYVNDSAMLAALPSRNTANDDAGGDDTSMYSAAVLSSDTAPSGGGNRGGYYRRRSTASDEDKLASAYRLEKPEKKDGIPDLRQFLPKMGGMRAAGAEEFDGHGAHAHIFEKVHERYNVMEHTLFQEAPGQEVPSPSGPPVAPASPGK